MANTELFNSAMLAGQELHGQGDFTEARDHWQIAENHAPDAVSAGRAIRGDAASAAKLGYLGVAVERAQTALVLHGDAAAENPVYRREEAQTRGVLARLMFKSIGTEEYHELMPTAEARKGAVLPLVSMRRAVEVLGGISREAERTDQHLLNLLPHMATGEALYGDQDRARHLLGYLPMAVKLTESPDLPTSAHISERHRRTSQLRMAAYAGGAALVTTLAAAPKGRHMALGVARGRAGW